MKRALLILLTASSALAKPLYITVPRTFGTDEAPQLSVSFAEREAVELRVLKPKSLDAFLKSQASLRRAYDPPPTFANPGRALSRGLNAVKSPVDTLRFALNLDFRRGVLPALEEAVVPPKEPVKLAEGPERIVGVPGDMTLVRSQWLNLDLGGADRDFNVPGFEAWNGSSGFQDREVVLDPLPAGIYVVQMVQGTVEGQVVLVVSDFAVVVKQASSQALVRVANRAQEPVVGATVTVRAGPKVLTATTDENGEASVQTGEPRLLVTAASAEDTALVDTDYFSTLAVVPDVFIYSDRPLYKPQDVVRFRGVLRQPDSALARLFKPKRSDLEVSLLSAEATAVKVKVKVNEFGAFSGQLTVPAGLDTGVLRLVANVDGPEHQAEARVQEYVKPTFFVEVLNDDETVTPGTALKAKVRARRYAGGVPANTVFNVYLYRTQVDAPAWVDDSGLGGAGSAVTYGTPSTTEGTLSIPQKLWASDELQFDPQGEADISVDVPPLREGDARKPWRYSISVRAKDDQGTFANAAKNLYLAESESGRHGAGQAEGGEARRAGPLLGPRHHALGQAVRGDLGPGELPAAHRRGDGGRARRGHEVLHRRRRRGEARGEGRAARGDRGAGHALRQEGPRLVRHRVGDGAGRHAGGGDAGAGPRARGPGRRAGARWHRRARRLVPHGLGREGSQ